MMWEHLDPKYAAVMVNAERILAAYEGGDPIFITNNGVILCNAIINWRAVTSVVTPGLDGHMNTSKSTVDMVDVYNDKNIEFAPSAIGDIDVVYCMNRVADDKDRLVMDKDTPQEVPWDSRSHIVCGKTGSHACCCTLQIGTLICPM